MKTILVIFLLLFFSAAVVRAADQIPEFKFELTNRITTPIIKRSGVYDYQASALKDDDGHWKVWDCGQESSAVGSDSIVYTEFDSQGNKVKGPMVVMTANHGDDRSMDNLHTCSPTVIKHKFPQMDPDGPSGPMPMGGEYYLMYYECAPLFYNKCDGSSNSTNGGTVACNPALRNDEFTQICAAASADGINWMKYSSDLWSQSFRHFGDAHTPPTPVVKVSPLLAANCGWDENDFAATGKMRIYLQSDKCMNIYNNYGVGQPGSMAKKTAAGGLDVWLYYADSKGDFFQRGSFLIKSQDGIHFGEPQKVNTTFSTSLIKYFPGQINGHSGVFITMGPVVNDNYFAYSYDGLNWVAPDYDRLWLENGRDPLRALSLMEAFKVGHATTGLCMLPGKIGLLGDKYGYLDSLADLKVFSGEGHSGINGDCSTNTHLDTWGINLISGNFIALPPTSTPPACTPCSNGQNRSRGDANCDGSVNLTDFTAWANQFLSYSKTNLPKSDYSADFNCDSKVTLADFVTWRQNFGK